MQKEIDKLKYNPEFLEFVFSYLDNYKILEIDINKLNNFSAKEKHVLTRIKDIYSKVKLLKDHERVSLMHFSNDDILEIANQFLIELFPKKKDEILGIDNLIEFGNYSINDAAVSYNLSKNNISYNKIMIPENGTLYTSSVIVHEKVHVLAFNNLEPINVFINKIELFPTFIQRMMLNYTGSYYSDILDRMIRINDTRENFYNLDMMHYIKNNSNKTILDEHVCNYFNLRCFDYLISELYSDLLLKYYLSDKEKMFHKINQVFDKKISISDFLNYYNINLLNKDLIPTIKEETNKCKRISIIP